MHTLQLERSLNILPLIAMHIEGGSLPTLSTRARNSEERRDLILGQYSDVGLYRTSSMNLNYHFTVGAYRPTQLHA